MVEESMEEGSRWTSFTPHERDLRMQNGYRDYDFHEMDSRQPPRSGQYSDPGTCERGPPGMKSVMPNQQVAGWRKANPSPVAHQFNRREGPNWIVIAGGALVTAIGVLIVRRQKPFVSDVKVLEKTVSVPLKDIDHMQQSGLSFATARRESTGSRTSELSAESPFSGDPFLAFKPQSLSEGSRIGSEWGDENCTPISPPAIYYSNFSKGSNHSNRTVITPTSPPGSYRGAETSATECNDPLELSPPGWGNVSSRRDMVHRLRQQLKSRDEMILDMQAQISDQERSIHLHQAHCREMESRLEVANKTLLESGYEIQRLQSAVSDYLHSHIPSPGEWNKPNFLSAGLSTYDSDNKGPIHQWPQPDGYFVMTEARRLAEELKSQEDEKRELRRLASLKSKEHELVVQRLRKLEAELEKAKESDFGKGLLLEAYEVEHENLEDRVDNLKRLIEKKTPEKTAPSSMIGRKSLSGSVGLFRLEYQHTGPKEELESPKPNEFSSSARSLVWSGSALLERSDSSRASSSGKGKFKADESSSNGDASDDSETDDFKPPFGEKSLVKLQQEVEQLSVILADHSDMISEKRLETTRLLDEFQRHNALISDIQKRLDETVEGKPESQDQVWENHSQYLSFANDTTSAFQVQELSHKLEQIEKQQRVEEEIAELSKHQVKIAELKQRVEKLLNKCQNLEDNPGSVDRATRMRAGKVATVGFELAKQLALQEEQARQTSIEVQRLSASFQLSSPYVPRSKKEELRKMLQDTSSESISPPLEIVSQETINVSRLVSLLESRPSTGSEGKAQKNGDFLFDSEISVSSAELTTRQSGEESRQQVQELYEYKSGFPESTRKLQRGLLTNLGSGKDQSNRAKRRTARGIKNGLSTEVGKDLVPMDWSRWISNTTLHVESSDTGKEQLTSEKLVSKGWSGGHEIGKDDEWSQKFLLLHSAPAIGHVQPDTGPWVSGGSPVSHRHSSSSYSDSSIVRIGSPTGDIDSTKVSFGKFLFDMEYGNDACGVDEDDSSDAGISGNTNPSPIMPASDSMDSSHSSLKNKRSFGSNTMELIVDKGKGLLSEPEPEHDKRHKNSGSISESSLSIGSSFDALLDDTLNDLLLICSTPNTPIDTPESNYVSSQM